MADLPYKDFVGSWRYIYNIGLGNADDKVYFYGKSPDEKYFLYLLFIISTFMIMLHLLNMLIAIMGNTQTERNEVAD